MGEIELWRHADDLGATPRITEDILACWQAGWLDGFSIFANGEATERVREALRESALPARIRVHLNLSEGASSAPPSELPLLVDDRGRLALGFVDVWRRLHGSQRRRFIVQVRREWAAQIERVIALVGPRSVDGVDGHVHVHAFPALFQVAAELARAYGLGGIRIPREPLHVVPDPRANRIAIAQGNLVKHGVLRACSRHHRAVATRLGLSAPDAFVGVLYSGAMRPSSVRAGVAAAERAGARSVEILFHPGRASAEESGRWESLPSMAYYPTSEDRDRERDCLRALYGSGDD